MPLVMKVKTTETRCATHRLDPAAPTGVELKRETRREVQQATETAARSALDRLRAHHGPDYTPPRMKPLKCPHCAAAAALTYLNGETDE